MTHHREKTKDAKKFTLTGKTWLKEMRDVATAALVRFAVADDGPPDAWRSVAEARQRGATRNLQSTTLPAFCKTHTSI